MRPKVIVNCAVSIDGKIALPSRRQTRISNEEDIARVHRLRNECDAILVGVGTILSDDPNLTVKEKYVQDARKPLRIVLDSNGRTPLEAEVLKGDAPTLIVTSEGCESTFGQAEVARFGEDEVDISSLLSHLYEKGVRKVLVEGGETVIWTFLKEGLVNELKVFVGSMVIGGVRSPTLAGGEGAAAFEDIIPLVLTKSRQLGDGILLEYEVKR
ncbi:MAG: 2,5-diamino-6-(ribosylamino)-4(3H)-pyrimidinone 5'-phosphate reductase [Methanomassiliicoccales archaeon]|nr:MAG: 2,5-diamino-6-(ribosylamino)-4(3H)-pyrimidinone 5'-phosphate reductase [Methanomassiliicoccales archaeon]